MRIVCTTCFFSFSRTSTNDVTAIFCFRFFNRMTSRGDFLVSFFQPFGAQQFDGQTCSPFSLRGPHCFPKTFCIQLFTQLIRKKFIQWSSTGNELCENARISEEWLSFIKIGCKTKKLTFAMLRLIWTSLKSTFLFYVQFWRKLVRL